MWSKWSFLVFQEFPLYTANKSAISEADTTAVLCRQDSVVLLALNMIDTKILKWSHDSQVLYSPHFFVLLEKSIRNVFNMKLQKDAVLHEGVPSSWCSEDLFINSNKITVFLTYGLTRDTDLPFFLVLFLCLLPGEENNSKCCDSKKLMWQRTYFVMKIADLNKTAWKIYSIFLLFKEVPFILILLEFFSWVLC